MIDTDDTLPWYRQFWPWFLILFPLGMIVICIALFYVALEQPISMVKKDYYQEGLTINKNIAEIKRARSLGLQAQVHFRDDRHLQLVLTAGNKTFELPAVITLQLDHPMDDRKDLSFDLGITADNTYVSQEINQIDWQLLSIEKHWYIHVQAVRNGVIDWVLQGEINQPGVHDLAPDSGRG